MANADFLLCDVCGARVPTPLRIEALVGRQMCPSGNGSEDVVELVDLCHSHAVEVIRMLVARNSDAGKRLVEFSRKKVKR